MIQRIEFDSESYFSRLRKRSFDAVIFFPLGDPITGEPLVTLAQNVGLPPVKDFYARMKSEPGPGGGTAYHIRLRVRFDGRIRRNGKLRGKLAVNVYVEGATEYIPYPPEG